MVYSGANMESARHTDQRSHRVVEKRRRDRINTCLKELSRAVPGNFNTQSSGKLEKAEILEMTVKYLQALETSSSLLHVDWRSSEYRYQHYQTGYDECVREVARCLPVIGHHLISRGRGERLLTHLLTARGAQPASGAPFRPHETHPTSGAFYRPRETHPASGATSRPHPAGIQSTHMVTPQHTMDATITTMAALCADGFEVNLKREPSAFIASRTAYYNNEHAEVYSRFVPYWDSRRRPRKYRSPDMM